MTRPASFRGKFSLFSLGAAAAAATIAAVLMLALMLVGFLSNNYGLIYAGLATGSFLLPLVAGLRRGKDFDPLEPINLVALAFFYGTTARAFWLLSSEGSRVDFIMMGTSLEDVSGNAPLMLLSVLSLVLGYAICTLRIPLERWNAVRTYVPSRNRVWIAIGLAAAISLVGIPMMISELHINFSHGLLSASSKKLAEYVDDNGDLVYGAGYQRWMAAAVSHGFVLLVAALIARVVRLQMVTLIVVACLLAMSMVTPFLTSSRTSLILLFLSVVIFSHYYGKLKVSQVVFVLIVSLPIFVAMGNLREANQQGVRATDVTSIDRVLGSGNSIDLVRTSAIMDRVPKVVNYQYGLTYAAIVGAVVPRAMWVNKPQVGLGGFVKGKIFGVDTRNGGWPSGLIAEGWINFGIIGLFVPMFIWGAMLRVLYESVKPLLGVSFPVTLAYSIAIWRIGFDGIGLNFAHTVSQVIAFSLPMIGLLIIANAPSGYRRMLQRQKGGVKSPGRNARPGYSARI